ncbi:cupin domain-containing protein [Agaribacter marinus]|uniref:Cupin domain-containing protein n=2 Tax=Virgibacillus TaxID=84406 RepID=A0A941DTY7_9BACI|nr:MULTISPECIES: cupin domain-containing protein [Virgibacillus]MBR7795681.1 cupin domain-containing protein [Virgibacillus salarius]MDY7043185.1 cupin domain-containing protein [Virgibacillus sp. M23]NAZ08394.1 cupin domain-containing protein [Agaribacter marinus]
MYYMPQAYPYFHYNNVGTAMYDSNNQSRSTEENYQSLCESILEEVKRVACVTTLYQELANVAPNEEHADNIRHALAGKKDHLAHVTNLYIQLTGAEPDYQVNDITFESYQQGLQRAYELEVEGYQAYQKGYFLTQQDPQIRNIFLAALNGDQVNVSNVEQIQNGNFRRPMDYGGEPFVIDIEEATKQNNTFRTAIWTGDHLQVTLMSIDVGESIGLEVHPSTDQFLRIEEGEGFVQMGDRKDQLTFEANVNDDDAIMVPAGKWHNITNVGTDPLKLYSIYAPPEHPFGTVHKTKAEAMAAEKY